MRSIFQKILLIQSILITNLIILVGSSSHINLNEQNTSYTFKNISEDLESFISEDGQKTQLDNSNNFIKENNQLILSVLIVSFLIYFIFRTFSSYISYNIQPKVYCSNL